MLLVGFRTMNHHFLLSLLSVAHSYWRAYSRLRVHDDVIDYVKVVIDHTSRTLEGWRGSWRPEDLRGRLVRATCGGQLWRLCWECKWTRRLGRLLQQGYFGWWTSLYSSLRVVEGSTLVEPTHITLSLSCVHKGSVLEEVIVVWVLNSTTPTHPKVRSWSVVVCLISLLI